METLLSFIKKKVEGVKSKDVFDYFFDLGAEKGKKYLHELFEKWDLEHLEIDDDFKDGLEDNVGNEGIQNLKDD